MSSDADIVESLRRLDLIGADQTPRLETLTGGISSEIYRVALPDRTVCIKRALPTLKSDPDWHVPVGRSAAEWQWFKLVHDMAPNMTPEPIAYDPQGNLLVMQYLPPGQYPNWKDQLRDGIIDPMVAATVAEKLLLVHNSTAGNGELVDTFANDKVFFDIRLEAYFLAAGRNLPDVAALMSALVDDTANAKLALVHGDISPKNILIGPEGPVFIDAECAWYGEPAFDAAFCLTHFLLKCLWRPQWKNLYLQCHQQFIETYLANPGWLGRDELESRITRLHLAMLLARVAGRSPVEYLTAPADKALVTAFAVDHLKVGTEALGDVARDWRRQIADD